MSTSYIRWHQERKKTNFARFRSTPSYLRWSGTQQFASVRRLSIRGSFDGRQMPAFRFLIWSLKFWRTTDTGIQVFDPVHQWLVKKPERRHPSSIKTSRYWWTTDAGLKIVAFQIACRKYKGVERMEANSAFFFLTSAWDVTWKFWDVDLLIVFPLKLQRGNVEII